MLNQKISNSVFFIILNGHQFLNLWWSFLHKTIPLNHLGTNEGLGIFDTHTHTNKYTKKYKGYISYK